MMSIRLLCRLATPFLRTEVQLAPRRCALFGNNRAVCYRARTSRSYGASTKSRTTSLWSLLCELAAGLKKSNRPSSRLLFSGAIAFLWERERIPTDDAISCLKEYDNRVKSQLHLMLEESPVGSSTTVPYTSGQELVPSADHVPEFKHQLQVLLQQNSDKHLSRLPLVGLQEMGRISSASAKAGEIVHGVTHEAIGRFGEAKVYLSKLLRSRDEDEVLELEEFEELVDSQDGNLVDAASVGVEVCQNDYAVSEDTVKATTEAMLGYYAEHSKRHMAGLPLVGLQNPGPVYNFSRNVAEFGRKLFTRDSNIHSQALFLAHLGILLWDMPSVSLFPQSLSGLQIDSTSLVTEGFANLSVKDALDSAMEQAKVLLSTCTSPRVVLDTFDSISNREGELHNSNGRTGTEVYDKDGTSTSSQRSASIHQSEVPLLLSGNCSTEEQSQCTGTDVYLEQSGWERFADAQNCTVYRKPHHSGLFMYKVIGRFTDISVKEFLDVQVDHACRKEWDSYVQKLETVEVDPETGTEVVHWVMKFPFPMSSREYLYARRMWMNKNVALLINRSVTHPAVPIRKNFVRVQEYVSNTVMYPHTTTYEDGFEYEVTYFDNPQTNLPSSCVNWVATAAMPEFLTKVHAAARQKKRMQSELLATRTT